jgi:hypothetical protein
MFGKYHVILPLTAKYYYFHGMETTEPVNTGAMLRRYVDEKRIRQGAWSRTQNVNRETVRKYFKKTSMQTTTLFAVCHALKYNFFADLAATLPAEYGYAPGALQQQLDALRKENETLKTQVELLKEVVKK